MRKFKFFLFIMIFSLSSVFVFAQNSEVTTITITNARKTTYEKDKKTGADSIILEGSVKISVSKGQNSTEISADKVSYDRKSEMLYAEGNVSIVTKSGTSGGETATAASLMMNTATLEGVFEDGRVIQTKSDAINLPSGSTLVVFSDIFGKTESNVIAFKNSSLTFCDADEPHWRIDATRTWLLPGGEFAFFNALLYVGNIPILYFPAFYYPKDELIFNPVFSFKQRTGYSIQTTTYLYGRKPLDSSSSSSSSSSSDTAAESLAALYNFMKPGTLKDQKREGLVLHNLDSDYTGNTTNFTKLMVDWHANLGYLAGIAGNLSPLPSYISELSFNLYTGFSTTIFESSGTYMPYGASGNQYWDHSSFMGFDVPFRYSAGIKFSLTKPFKFSLSLPLYSDPYFNDDFLADRQESMDWISYVLSATKSDDDSTTTNELSSFTWSATSSYTPVLPTFLKPYISSASISLKSSVNFSSKSASSTSLYENYDDSSRQSDSWASYTPERKFYYPSQVVPVNLTASISGTIFQYPKESSTKKSSSEQKYDIPLTVPEDLKSEKQKEAEKLAKQAEEAKQNEESEKSEENGTVNSAETVAQNAVLKSEEEKTEDENDLITPQLPELSHSVALNSLDKGLEYKLTYSFSPSLTTQIAYSSTMLNKSSDFSWKNLRSFMYTAKLPASLNSALSYGGSFLSLNNKLSFEPIFQDHPYILTYDTTDNGGYTESAKNTLLLADRKASARNIINTNSFSINPFINSEYFSGTGLSWNSTIKLLRYEFLGDKDNLGEENYEWHGLEWDDDCITVNTLNLKLSAQEKNSKFKQNLTFTTILPPQLMSYSATLNLVFPYLTTNFSAGITQKSTDTSLAWSEQWTTDNLQQSATLNLFDSKLKFTESFNYNIKDATPHPESLKLSTSWSGLSLAYVMSHTYPYDLVEGTGWVAQSEKKFVPYSLTLAFSKTSKTLYTWQNRISLSAGLSTNISLDFLRATNSSFTFSPSITFKINEFFNLTFSSTSKNSIIYWYFHEGNYDEGGVFPFNMLVDLANSFRFDDRSLREGSGFKIKSLNMTMSHNLHDWSFNMTMSISPKIVTKYTDDGSYKTYDFTPKITIGIVWNPMQSIKSNLVYDYDKTKGVESGVWTLED